MFHNRYVLEVKGAEDRIYRFDCSDGSPRGECYDALATMMGIIVEQIKQAAGEEKLSEPKAVEKEECKECPEEGVKEDGAAGKV